MLDLERGVVSEVHPEPWQTDTCVGDWFYKRGITYKTPQVVVQMLVDIKNGNLDAEEDRIVEGIAKWMAVNSEAIYSTRPWKLFGEGPTQAAGGQFSERKAKVYRRRTSGLPARARRCTRRCWRGRKSRP